MINKTQAVENAKKFAESKYIRQYRDRLIQLARIEEAIVFASKKGKLAVSFSSNVKVPQLVVDTVRANGFTITRNDEAEFDYNYDIRWN